MWDGGLGSSAGPRRPVLERKKQAFCNARLHRHGGFTGDMTISLVTISIE